MKIVKILNTVALLLIFAPFFQMCGARSETSETQLSGDTLSNSTEMPVVRQGQVVQKTDEVTDGAEEKSKLEKIWDSITFPGYNATAFGMLVSTVFSIFEGYFAVSLLAVLNLVSVFLTIATLVLLLRSKYAKLVALFIMNLICLLGAYITAQIEIEYEHPVKWGFYAYFIILLAATITLFIVRRDINRSQSA